MGPPRRKDTVTIRDALLAILFVFLLVPAAAADEPEWGGQPLSHWIKQLEQGATGLGKAPEALIALGPKALPALRQALMGLNPNAQTNAAEVLGQMGAVAEPLLPDLAELMADDYAGVRAAAALALGRVGRALHNEDASLETLERLTAAAARLRERMEDPDKAVRARVLQGMALMGGFSENDIRLLLQERPRRRVVFASIRELKAEATGIAVNLLKHPSWHVRLWTLQGMFRAELDDRAWLPALADRTHDESEAVAHQALNVLADKAPKSADAATLTLRAFKSPHPRVSSYAALALARCKENGPAATRHLRAALSSQFEGARMGAAWALGNSNDRSVRKAVVTELTERLTDAHLDVRWCAARSLVVLGQTPDAAMPPLYAASTDSVIGPAYSVEYVDDRGDAIMGGKKRNYWGFETPRAAEAWAHLLTFKDRGAAFVAKQPASKDEHRRWQKLNLLAKFKDAALPHLKKMLEARDPELRQRVALTLAALGDKSLAYLPELMSVLERRAQADENERAVEEPVIGQIDWHATALTAIKKLGADAVPKALDHLAASTRSDQRLMQPGLKEWLVKIGEPAVPHLDALRANFELGQWINAVIAAIESKKSR